MKLKVVKGKMRLMNKKRGKGRKWRKNDVDANLGGLRMCLRRSC
jgi:hypothetical protein